jgi:hypothetical protein
MRRKIMNLVLHAPKSMQVESVAARDRGGDHRRRAFP